MKMPIQYEISTIEFAKQKLTLPAIVSVSSSQSSEILTSIRSSIIDEDFSGIPLPSTGLFFHSSSGAEVHHFCGNRFSSQTLPMLPPLSAILLSSDTTTFSDRIADNEAFLSERRSCDASADSAVCDPQRQREMFLARLQSAYHPAARSLLSIPRTSDSVSARCHTMSAHSSSSSFTSVATSTCIQPTVPPRAASVDVGPARTPSRSPPLAPRSEGGSGNDGWRAGDGEGVGAGDGLYAGLMAVIHAQRHRPARAHHPAPACQVRSPAPLHTRAAPCGPQA
jgi:hypothetical protein